MNASKHEQIVAASNAVLFQRVPKLQQEDQATWWDNMCKMQKLFRKAAQTLYSTNKIDHEAMHNYFMAGEDEERYLFNRSFICQDRRRETHWMNSPKGRIHST